MHHILWTLASLYHLLSLESHLIVKSSFLQNPLNTRICLYHNMKSLIWALLILWYKWNMGGVFPLNVGHNVQENVCFQCIFSNMVVYSLWLSVNYPTLCLLGRQVVNKHECLVTAVSLTEPWPHHFLKTKTFTEIPLSWETCLLDIHHPVAAALWGGGGAELVHFWWKYQN